MARTGGQTEPRILGLTGPIGCGKTTVGDILLRLGALERIDADQVVHELMQPGTEVTAAIAAAFGSEVLTDAGATNRSRLAGIVFANSEALHTLESIVHPAVRAAIRTRLDGLAGRKGVVVVDAVKLLQSELLPLCDVVWLVRCPEEEQTRRLTALRGMQPEAARARIAAQPSFDHPRVDTIIENAGSMEGLERQVEGALRRL